MAEKFIGTWALDFSEKFDEYMKAVDVSYVTRKMAAVLKPNVILSVNGDTWTLKTESTLKVSETSFKLGEEYEETTPDGRTVMTTFTLDNDGKLVQEQKGKVPSIITRELIDDNTLLTTCVAKDVTCKRKYKKVIG
jgi:hypothetical protein